jgi:pyridoxine kinase
MPNVLSIQSYVAYGYVGNRAAVFPLQLLGYDVIAINTVQFSNHTGYGKWFGDVMTTDHIRNVIHGLRKLGKLHDIDAVLTGYMGDAALANIVTDTIQELRSYNSDLIYCCDPVMGDVGRGFFVKRGLSECFRDTVIQHANIITPNQFEAEYLSGIEIHNMHNALTACEKLIKLGPEIILLTSLMIDETPEDKIQMLVYKQGEVYLITTPKFYFDIAPNGSGDLTAAIFFAQYLSTHDLKQALEYTAASVYGIFHATYQQQTRELQLISAQHEITQPAHCFKAEKIS